MPYNSISINLDPVPFATGILLLEQNYLTSVMLEAKVTHSDIAQNYGQIFLASTETPRPIIISLLAAGYLGSDVQIGWTGRLELEPTYGVMARVWSRFAGTFKLYAITEKK